MAKAERSTIKRLLSRRAITIFSTFIYGNLSFNKIKTFSLDFYLLFLFVIEPSRSRTKKLNGKWTQARAERGSEVEKWKKANIKENILLFTVNWVLKHFLSSSGTKEGSPSQGNHLKRRCSVKISSLSPVSQKDAADSTSSTLLQRLRKLCHACWSIIHLDVSLRFFWNFVTVNYKLFLAIFCKKRVEQRVNLKATARREASRVSGVISVNSCN